MEIVEHLPDLTLLETCQFIREIVFGNILQEFAENMVKCHEVDELGRVFFVGVGNVFHDRFCDILQLVFVLPEMVKGGQELLDGLWVGIGRHHGVAVVATLTAKVDGGEAIQGRIHDAVPFDALQHQEAIHHLAGYIGLECGFFGNPLGALLRDRFLRHFIAQLDLILGAVQAMLAIHARDIKFALFFRRSILRKCRRGVDKAEILDR